MKFWAISWSVVLLIHMGLAPLQQFLPPSHHDVTMASASGTCGQAHHDASRPHQHRAVLQGDQSLVWHSVYSEECRVPIPSEDLGGQAASQPQSPVGSGTLPTTPHQECYTCLCCSFVAPTLAPYQLSVRIITHAWPLAPTGHRPAIDHPPQNLPVPLTVA